MDTNTRRMRMAKKIDDVVVDNPKSITCPECGSVEVTAQSALTAQYTGGKQVVKEITRFTCKCGIQWEK